MISFQPPVLSPRRALAGGFFLLLAPLVSGQINTASTTFQLDLTLLGGYYEEDPSGDDISDLLELSLGAYPINGINGVDQLGTYSSSFFLNGNPVDFEEDDIAFGQNDTFGITLTASAMAGPGATDFSLLSVATNLYGSMFESEFPEATLVFDYSWSWNTTLQEHASPSGNTSGAVISGYESNQGFFGDDPNFLVIDDLIPLLGPDDEFRYGLGSHLHDGLPHDLDEESGTGQLYLGFDTNDGYIDMNFLSEVQAYAAIDTVIPEPAGLWTLFAGLMALVPVLRRKRT